MQAIRPQIPIVLMSGYPEHCGRAAGARGRAAGKSWKPLPHAGSPSLARVLPGAMSSMRERATLSLGGAIGKRCRRNMLHTITSTASARRRKTAAPRA
jgi:hypothetical protein